MSCSCSLVIARESTIIIFHGILNVTCVTKWRCYLCCCYPSTYSVEWNENLYTLLKWCYAIKNGSQFCPCISQGKCDCCNCNLCSVYCLVRQSVRSWVRFRQIQTSTIFLFFFLLKDILYSFVSSLAELGNFMTSCSWHSDFPPRNYRFPEVWDLGISSFQNTFSVGICSPSQFILSKLCTYIFNSYYTVMFVMTTAQTNPCNSIFCK